MKLSFMHKLVLVLANSLMLLHTPVLFAKSSPEALSEMEWPLQPGETVRDLAQMIYPKNPHMQKYFIAETIKLNQALQPDLHPSTIFSQPNVILIPSIKQLSHKDVTRGKR
ncbi:MAG: hypothetical protein VW395_02210 [Methylotenera sp.]